MKRLRTCWTSIWTSEINSCYHIDLQSTFKIVNKVWNRDEFYIFQNNWTRFFTIRVLQLYLHWSITFLNVIQTHDRITYELMLLIFFIPIPALHPTIKIILLEGTKFVLWTDQFSKGNCDWLPVWLLIIHYDLGSCYLYKGVVTSQLHEF